MQFKKPITVYTRESGPPSSDPPIKTLNRDDIDDIIKSTAPTFKGKEVINDLIRNSKEIEEDMAISSDSDSSIDSDRMMAKNMRALAIA